MPVVKCRCGGITNSAISEYWMRKDQTQDIADGCYVKLINERWEKGCLFDSTKPTDFMRLMAVKMIKGDTE